MADTKDPQDMAPRFEGDQFIVETDSGSDSYDAKFLVAVLLVYVAKGDGVIQPEESDRMLQVIGDHFSLRSGESLELLRRAMTDMAENPNIRDDLRGAAAMIRMEDRDEIASMMAQVLAADGKADAESVARMKEACTALGIGEDVVKAAIDRHFG